MPKRKSDVLDANNPDDPADFEPPAAKALKKARKSASAAAEDSESDDGSSEDDAPSSSKAKAKPKAKPTAKEKKAVGAKRWQDVELDDEDDLPIFDDCNEIRRKIRLLQKESDFKVTHWLKEIGGVNSNSYGRFMKSSGPQGGAENGTYRAAYIYFEKRRIAEGKKKTAKRLRNEQEYGSRGGMPLRDGNRPVWVIVGRDETVEDVMARARK